MPCEYEIFQNQNIIVRRYTGCVTTRCVLHLLDRIEADENYLEGMQEIDDLRFVSDFAIPDPELERLADLMKCIYDRRKGRLKRAVVATSEEIVTSVRNFCGPISATVDIDCRIFSEMESALNFLDQLDTPFAKELLRDTHN